MIDVGMHCVDEHCLMTSENDFAVVISEQAGIGKVSLCCIHISQGQQATSDEISRQQLSANCPQTRRAQKMFLDYFPPSHSCAASVLKV